MRIRINTSRMLLLGPTILVGLSCTPVGQPASNLAVINYDAGPIVSNKTTKLRHVFKVRNDQTTPLHIKEITKSCACTSATISRNSIDPGGEAELSVEVETRPVINDWHINCRVITDHPTQPDQDFSIDFRTYPSTTFRETSVQFGELVSAGQDSEQVMRQCSLEIYEMVDSPADSLNDIQGQSPIAATFNSQPDVEFIEDGKVRRSVYRVSATLSHKRGTAAGTQAATIEAKTNLGQTASVTATWSDALPIKVTPSRLHFGSLENLRESEVKTILIKSYNNKPFKVVGFFEDSNLVVCEQEHGELESPQHHISVKFQGGDTAKRFVTGKLTIKTDYPGVAEVQVPWSVIIKDTAASIEGSPMPGGSGRDDTAN